MANYSPEEIMSHDMNDTKSIKIWTWPSLEEKIDFIYKELKNQRRNRRINYFIKFLFFTWIIYLVFFYIPNMSESIKKEIEWKISNYISQTVWGLMKNMASDMTQDLIKNIEEKASNLQK